LSTICAVSLRSCAQNAQTRGGGEVAEGKGEREAAVPS